MGNGVFTLLTFAFDSAFDGILTELDGVVGGQCAARCEAVGDHVTVVTELEQPERHVYHYVLLKSVVTNMLQQYDEKQGCRCSRFRGRQHITVF